MGSLASELVPVAARLSDAPRIYADANLPQGIVRAMRESLGWDVLFVLEHDDLRRASDREHYARAREQGRTLVTLDRDFLDEKRFPVSQSGGVIVCSAPGERELLLLLERLDRELFRAPATEGATLAAGTPLAGRKLDWHPGATL